MTSKIFKSIFITSVTVLVSATVLVMMLCYNYYYDRAADELRREAEYIMTGIEADGVDYLKAADADGVRVTLINGKGEAYYDTEGRAGSDNYLLKEEISEALSVGEGMSSRTSELTGNPTLYYAVKMSNGDVLRVASAHFTVMTMLLSIIGPISMLLLLVLIFAFLSAKRLSGAIVAPINATDPDNVEKINTFPELKPIMDKLASQKIRISQQMSEINLRRQEFNSITENMSEGMIIINFFAEVVSCNKSAKQIFEIGIEAPKNILNINDSQSFKDAIMAALSGENGYDTLRKGDRYYSIIATPVVRDGTVDGAVIIIIDDTEKEEREALRREFTSNISHELKTPLTSISGFAEILSLGLSSPDETVHFAKNIQKESKRLITLVGDIIRLTQLDGREIPYDGEINLKSVATDVIERLENVAGAAGVSLLHKGTDAVVLGNYTIIEEIIYNLCDNGIKYNVSGGQVTVETFLSGADSVPTLRVSDTGIGIPKDELDRVFERFYRVDKSHSKQIGGTGLGLSIVKHAALYHKANIKIESEVGVGTVINVSFPVTAPSE